MKNCCYHLCSGKVVITHENHSACKDHMGIIVTRKQEQADEEDMRILEGMVKEGKL